MWRPLSRRISYLEAHHRFGISFACALAAFGIAHGGKRGLPLELIAGWDAYALCFLLLSWVRMLNAQPHVLARLARLQHHLRTLILLFALGGAVASLGAVGLLLSTAKAASGASRSEHVLIAVGTVVLSWFLVHTVFALFYAYLFYRQLPTTSAKRSGGLAFPETKMPDYADFAYFSFVIGMTSQVSDVQITGRTLRRWALLHGLISFAFNLAIVGLSINVIASLF
jgi:uncharacterized membrane protein